MDFKLGGKWRGDTPVRGGPGSKAAAPDSPVGPDRELRDSPPPIPTAGSIYNRSIIGAPSAYRIADLLYLRAHERLSKLGWRVSGSTLKLLVHHVTLDPSPLARRFLSSHLCDRVDIQYSIFNAPLTH